MFIKGNGQYIEYDEVIKVLLERSKQGNSIVVGCDSQRKKRKHIFVIAIAAVDEGNGGIFFIKKWKEIKRYAISEKLWKEGALVIEMAEKLRDVGIPIDKIEIHLDLSEDGGSRKFVKGIVGMCLGYGFEAKIKQEAWCSSGLADRYSRS